MVVSMCALGTMPEFPLFFGRGPLQSGVLQQLMQTEFTFPGEQKDWYPAEAIRHAAEDAQDLRYMIPVTQSKGYLVWWEHGFALQHDSSLKTVAKPVYVSKAMLVIKPDTSAVTRLTALRGSSTVTLVWSFLLFDSGWNQKTLQTWFT